MIYKIYEIGVCAVNLRIGGAMHILEYENYEETKITSPDSMASVNRNVIRICATGSQPKRAEPI